MNKVKQIITNRWFIQGLGFICLALLIWFVGPMIAFGESYFLASVTSRIIAILIVLLLFIANVFRIQWQAKKRNEQLVNDLSASQVDPTAEASAEEQQEIGARFEEALEILKKSNMGRGKKGSQFLYDLPWYIIIGPPGSGKTTALINSGLNFPLADKMGSESIGGIGGTRHCDWFFTDEAVMIDTAGRFTTQDSHQSVDKAAWQQFMDLLKRNRPQQPINGALITMSLADLMQQSEDQRQHYARTIRQRIDELQDSLGIEFPVYFTFTKCDLVPGFSEFFAYLDKEERNQVWGETFTLDKNGNTTFEVQNYPYCFDDLLSRLQNQLIKRLQDERDPDKRALIVGFPAQFSSLRSVVSLFVQEVFGDNRYHDGALLRGVYFTSGTQEGTPIDRLLGSLAHSLGVAGNTLVGTSGKGKSYFLHDLLRRVIFKEAGVAGLDMNVVRRRKWLYRTSLIAACLCFTGGALAWTYSYLNNDERIAETNTLVSNLQEQKVSEPLIGADFEAVLPELNTLRAATQIYNERGFDHKAGLYQGDKVNKGAQSAYEKRLEALLLPLLMTRIEELIIGNDPKDTDTLYELLRVYLLYAGVKPYDAELLSTWAHLDWEASYGFKPELVEQLKTHMAALMQAGFVEREFNPDIVQYARKVLSRDSLEKQVYQAVKRELLQNKDYDLLAQDMFGPYAKDVLSLRSGSDLDAYITPGMFTKDGFYKLFLPNSVSIGQQYLENNWVMGPKYAEARKVEPGKLQKRVLELYYQDFIQQWDGMLSDLRIATITSNDDGVRQVNLMAGLDSPLRYLLDTMSRETTLTKFAGGAKGEGGEELAKSVASLNKTLQLQQQRVSKLLRNARKAGLKSDLGLRVENHYRAFHKTVQTRGGVSLLDRLLKDLAKVALYLENANMGYDNGNLGAAQGRVAGGGQDPLAQLNTYKHQLPEKLQNLVAQIGSSNWQVMLNASKQELDKQWREKVVFECKSLVAGRYPLNRRARSEATLQDFSDFFAPNGVLDQFVNDNLKGFIDTRSGQWQERSTDGQQLGLSPQTLAQLQKGAKIRDMFFNNGELQVQFSMRPITMDVGVSRFQLNIGEQEVSYRHGPRRAVNLTWPSQGNSSVRILFENQNGSTATHEEQGPWAFMRLLAKAKLERTRNRAVYRVSFSKDGNTAVYELRAKSVSNPFGENLLSGFRCPESL